MPQNPDPALPHGVARTTTPPSVTMVDMRFWLGVAIGLVAARVVRWLRHGDISAWVSDSGGPELGCDCE